MSKIICKISGMMKKQNWAIVALNAIALAMVVQNVNAACAFIDHQPEVPDEAIRFKKIKQSI